MFSSLYVEAFFFYIEYCIVVKSFRLGRLGPTGGWAHFFGRLHPPGWIAVVRLTFSCLFSACLLGSFRRGLSCCAAGPLFRGAACLDFCVKPKGARPTYVWERVALSPRALLLGCLLMFVAFPFACFFSWFCLGFALAFLVEQCGGGLLVRSCAGQSRRVFFALQFCSVVSVLFPCGEGRRVLAVLRPGVHLWNLAQVLVFHDKKFLHLCIVCE